VAGPFCGRLLADFGAEVIKIESKDADTVRAMGKRLGDRSLYAASIFRNKSLISVDLRRPEGQAVVRRLVKSCAIVVENFRPGALERWQLGYQDLAQINPGLIMVRISGYGQDGPYAPRPGFGVIGEAVSGLRHITGDPDRPPARVATSLTDYITGLYGAFGAVMALLVQRQTGQGQYVDAALYECAFSFMEPHVPAFHKLGHVAQRAGSRLPDNTPNNLYPTSCGSFVHIAAIGEPIFRKLAVVIGQPGLVEDPRFATPMERNRHADEIDALIAAWTGTRTLADAEQVLHKAGIPATRIFTMRDIFSDPHFAARKAIVEVPDDELGSVKMTGVVPRLSATPGSIRHAGSGQVGADTYSVLRDIAGYDDAEIEGLFATGIVAGPSQTVPGNVH
jgi:crotonobetainyl-CoA:carnitine CoA-transferase CaiB-like acyl-CoA transferase